MSLYAGGRPYGDIYQVPTQERAVNAIADKIYKEHLQQEADKKRSADLLDQHFSANMSKMKDVDIPEFINKYNKFKQLNIALQRKGSKATPYDNLEVQSALSDAQSHLSASVQDKQDEENAAKMYYKNPNDFDENTPAFLAARRITPRSGYVKRTIDPTNGQEKIIDMTDLMGNIIDNGAGTDFTKLDKASLGTQSVRGKSTIEETPLTKTEITYKGYNPPSQYIDIKTNGIKSSREKRHYIIQNQKSDEEASKIIEAYNKLRETPEFKNAYPNEPEIPATMFVTPLGKTISLKAMEDAITNPPIAIRGKQVNKVEEVIDKKAAMANAEWDRRRPLKLADSLARIRANKGGSGTGTDAEDLGYRTDEYYANHGKSLTPDEEKFVTTLGGIKPQGYVEVSSIHPSDLSVIAGDPTKKEIRVQPVNLNGRDVYFVDNDGNWVGKNGIIDREAVRRKVIETRANTKFKVEQQANKKPFGNNTQGKSKNYKFD